MHIIVIEDQLASFALQMVLGISTNHIIRTAFCGDQNKINYKLFLLNSSVHIKTDKNETKTKLNDCFPTKIRNSCKIVQFVNIDPYFQTFVAEQFFERLGHQEIIRTAKEL